jgi:[ribosomal protein S5]-alanine N-acetyltransferase
MTKPVFTNILETERLLLRQFEASDAAFILRLVNDPAWLKYIGDRGIRTIEAAVSYLEQGPMTMYLEQGFGLYLVALKESGEPIGMCGIMKRDALEEIDLGFAFLPEFRSQGYAFESAAATITYAGDVLGAENVLAITSPENERSAKLLERLGFRFQWLTRLSAEAPEVKLYALQIRM